jgi:hypothetical protein
MIRDAQSSGTLVWPTPHASFAARPVEQRFTAGAAYVAGILHALHVGCIP